MQQQERFDRFREEFNAVRPHEALGQQPPGAIYQPSIRRLPSKLPEPEYSLHDDVLTVSSNGTVAIDGRKRNRVSVSMALVGQKVGVREEQDGRWLVTFMKRDLGHIDLAAHRFTPLNPA